MNLPDGKPTRWWTTSCTLALVHWSSVMYYQGNLHEFLWLLGQVMGQGPKIIGKMTWCCVKFLDGARRKMNCSSTSSVALYRVHPLASKLPFLIPQNKHLHLLASTKFLLANHILLSVRRLNYWRIRHSCVLQHFANRPRIVASELQWMVVSVFAMRDEPMCISWSFRGIWIREWNRMRVSSFSPDIGNNNM
jgi:hypothetical protein